MFLLWQAHQWLIIALQSWPKSCKMFIIASFSVGCTQELIQAASINVRLHQNITADAKIKSFQSNHKSDPQSHWRDSFSPLTVSVRMCPKTTDTCLWPESSRGLRTTRIIRLAEMRWVCSTPLRVRCSSSGVVCVTWSVFLCQVMGFKELCQVLEVPEVEPQVEAPSASSQLTEMHTFLSSPTSNSKRCELTSRAYA